MAKTDTKRDETLNREQLVALLNEDLAREYQAIISYVVYSQVLKGAEYMNIADQLEEHAHEELKHALIISRQIDYLGAMPTVTAKQVRTSEDLPPIAGIDDPPPAPPAPAPPALPAAPIAPEVPAP